MGVVPDSEMNKSFHIPTLYKDYPDTIEMWHRAGAVFVKHK